ncbi:MAG: hypothetical protein ACXVJ7_03260 [Acidimicrobiia bacterium]
MRTTLVKRVTPAVGALLHRSDELRARLRPPRSGPLPTAPRFCIAAVAYWRVPAREGYLLDTVRALRLQAPEVAVAISTNDAPGLAEAVRELADDVRVCSSVADAAESLLRVRDGIVCLDWSPPRHTHPYRLTWHHKALFRELVLRRNAFELGLTHLVYSEDDLRLAPDALDYWTHARPVLAPHGLIPGYSRFEGPPDDARLTDQQRVLRIDELPRLELPVSDEPGAPLVWWVNVPRPYQAMYVLDEPLARRHLATSRFRSPLRSNRTPTIGRGWDVRVRAAAGPMLDDTPPGFSSTAVIPVAREHGALVPYRPARIEHLPANYYADPSNTVATVPLMAGFVEPGGSREGA